LRRAGLDYHEWARVKMHRNFEAFLETEQPERLFGVSTKGQKNYADIQYQATDYLLFGPETRGLPAPILEYLGKENILRIPMRAESRSLNLSNAVAVLAYEAWRQLGFR